MFAAMKYAHALRGGTLMAAADGELSGFYKKTVEERRRIIIGRCGLTEDEAAIIAKDGPLPIDVANAMGENVIGTVGLPLSVALNFVIDGKEVIVPMAVEEPSVVAAASYGAKLAKPSGGFHTEYSGSIMIGQIQLVALKDVDASLKLLREKGAEIIKEANANAEHLTRYGGGVRGMSARKLKTVRGDMLIVEFHVDVMDAMGANAVNTILEKMAPKLEEMTGGKKRLRILTNLAIMRMAAASAQWKKEGIGGEEVVEGILDAWAFAMADPFRRATHNKGVMNGIDAVAVATGNDWRAVEAGAHSYADYKGGASLTTYRKTPDGDLEGKIALPLAVGTIGGSIRSSRTAQISLKIAGVKTSGELARMMAAVGLAQNFAALRAMASEGIQAGHMRLHAKNVALAAGAGAGEVEAVAGELAKGGKITAENAAEILKGIRKGKG